MAIPKLLDTINRGRLDGKICSCSSPDTCTETGFYTYTGKISEIDASMRDWVITVIADDAGNIDQEAKVFGSYLFGARKSSNGGTSWEPWSHLSTRESLGIYYGSDDPNLSSVGTTKEGDIYFRLIE